MKRFSLIFAIIINIFITATEAVVGLVIGSMALISDAVHNFSDVGALVLSWWGEKIKTKESNQQKTFGYKRAEIIIALLNSLVLVAVVIFIFYEAVGRLFNPTEIQGGVMMIMAAVALVGNGIATYLLEKDSHENLNLKSAWLHSFQDALFSLAVVLSAIILYFTHWFIIDPLISILLSFYILREAYKIIKEAVDVLMESTPDDIDFEEVKNTLKSFEGVKNAKDIHIWQTDSNSRFLSAHLEIDNLENEKRNQLLCLIQQDLNEKFNISHPTIQMISADEQEKLKFNCDHCN
ncbi:MAG: cation diffusion facilitator family transporter [Candidatus Moranbacteria bacterium]|nr:cation diffusion facilitator family transporter [Candidatus Moranbacteria bacterium]